MTDRMGNAPLIALLSVLLGLTFVFVAKIAAPATPTISRTDRALSAQRSLADLTASSDLIVRGRVQTTEAHWSDSGGIIVTDVRIALHYTILGQAGDVFTLQVPGGRMTDEDIVMVDDQSVPFVAEEEVLLFLRATGHGYALVDAANAKWVIGNGNVYTARHTLVQPLADFYAEMARTGEIAPPSDWAQREAVIDAQLPVIAGDYVPTGYTWFADSPVIDYHVNINSTQTGSGDGGPDDFLAAVIAAGDAWSSVPSADFTLHYAGPTSDTSMRLNGINAVLFTTDLPQGVLAQARYWYVSSTGRILEADIAVSDSYDLDTTGAPEPHELDVQSAVLHEFGHWLSLGHDDDEDAVMYAHMAPATVKRALHANDVAGITSLYPCAGQSCTPEQPAATPSPTPTFTPTATPTPLPTQPPDEDGDTIPPVPTSGVTVYPDQPAVIRADTATGAHVELRLDEGSVQATIAIMAGECEREVQVAGLDFTDIAVGLHAVVDEQSREEYALVQPGELTIDYNDVQETAHGDDADLYLYRYVPALDDWSEASCGAYIRDPANNTLTVDICMLGDWALMAQMPPTPTPDPDEGDDPPAPKIFLPIVARPA